MEEGEKANNTIQIQIRDVRRKIERKITWTRERRERKRESTYAQRNYHYNKG